MKKIACVFLTMIMLLTCFVSCAKEEEKDKIKKFSSESAMQETVCEELWACFLTYEETAQYNLYFFDRDGGVEVILAMDKDKTEQEMFEIILQKVKGVYSSFEALLESGENPEKSGMYSKSFDIEFDPENGTITSKGDVDLTWTFYEDGTMRCQGKRYYKDKFLSTLESSFASAIVAQGLEKLLKQHFSGEVVTYNDVKYNPYGYYNKKFVITGTLSLDDYYNYNYKNAERNSFCIRVAPAEGSTIGDLWYIYAPRSEFSTLYKTLQRGSVVGALVCECEYYDAASESMATLVDFYVK